MHGCGVGAGGGAGVGVGVGVGVFVRGGIGVGLRHLISNRTISSIDSPRLTKPIILSKICSFIKARPSFACFFSRGSLLLYTVQGDDKGHGAGEIDP